MIYSLAEINNRILQDPEAFVAECDARYHDRISAAADDICSRLSDSPVVLLSGPSGSGKTTTAQKVEEELRRRGIVSHTISMDNYFKDVRPDTTPRTAEGEYDYESPLCIDMELLNEHFSKLGRGEEIRIPHFMFARQKRSASMFTPLKLQKNEIAIFEGIHALNDTITDCHPEAYKLYISAQSDVYDGDELCFSGTWMRLVRRVVRDNNFRGASALFTIKLWANVLHGEQLHIYPFKGKADMQLDSALAYEVPALKRFAQPLFSEIPDDTEAMAELSRMIPALELFRELPEKYVKPDSLLREFIGGGVYSY
jgi:uridine kinase